MEKNLDAFHAQRGSRILKHFKHLGDIQLLKLPKGRNVQQALAEYQASGLVEFAELDYLVEPALAPDDPNFQDGSLWHLQNNGQAGGVIGADIHAPEGWETLHSASNIIVAIVDSGVRYTHQDLAANMWVNPGEIPGNGIDDDGNGFVDDVHGINASAHTGNPIDLEGHGTQVAGLVGAVGNNSLGIVGVAWKVQLMACRYSDDTGMGTISDVVECINYARSQGAHIINGSFIIGMYSATLYAAIASCRAQGILFVAAAGNSGRDNDVNLAYPANFELDNIVSVAATTRSDTLASFSNFGATSVDLAAPGSSIFTTHSGSDSAYTVNSGTSFAVPLVTGALALLKARYPDETYRHLIDRLLAATDHLPSLVGKCATSGRLNIARALGPAFTADFTANPTAGVFPVTVHFTNASFGAITQLAWDFGDGSGSAEPNPTHTYAREGNYTARLTATRDTGTTLSRSVLITALSDYQISSAAYQWLDPANPVALALGNDGVSPARALPFSFSFYGQLCTEFYVGANGLIGFRPEGLSASANSDLPASAAPNSLIAPFWDDLDPSAGGSVKIGTVGEQPDRKLVISWMEVLLNLQPAVPCTFQAILCEGTHQILFQYQNVQPDSPSAGAAGKSATIGIEHASGLVASKFSFNGSTPLSNFQAILFAPIPTITPPPGVLQVLATNDLVAGGFVGGPMAPETRVYAVTNSGGSPLHWSVSHTAAWVTLSATSGTLAPQSSTQVTVTINALANALPPGQAVDTLVFINTHDGNGSTLRNVQLCLKPLPRLTLARSPTSGQLEFSLNGEPGRSYVIQATTNLIDWTSVRTNSAGADGMLSFADTPSPDAPRRFFRALIAP